MTRYIDPNSGAAPQPGAWAGEEAQAHGFALANENEGVEQERQLNEAEDLPEEKSIQEIADAAAEADKDREKTEVEEYFDRYAEAVGNPNKVLGEEDEGDSASKFVADPGAEARASDAKALETQGVEAGNAGFTWQTPAEDADAEASEEDAEEVSEEEGYDPSQYSVDEVNAYLEENPDEYDAVIQSEKDGKNRKGIVGS